MNIQTVDLRLLRGFITVARAGTLTAAAQQLSITQSALSQQMKELADRLAVPILEKRGRNAALSEAGRDLYARVAPLIEQIDACLIQCASASERVAGRLRVGATQTFLRALALPAGTGLLRAHPDLRIDLRELPAHRLSAELLDGEIDMAVCPMLPRHPGVVQRELCQERLAAIGTAACVAGLGARPQLKTVARRPLVLLNRQFLVRQQIETQAALDKVELDVRLELSGMDELISAARDGSLLALGSPLAAVGLEDLKALPLSGKHLTRTVALCWRKGRVVTAAMRAFQDEVLARAKGLQARL
ncbi:MAG: LysR substrate-binding domain-containing protein [Candidatus Protistobacter heckmanni]|nr:LysR substrate-binding domain-containing protein [Candidatus Protistobacter heckmanni]